MCSVLTPVLSFALPVVAMPCSPAMLTGPAGCCVYHKPRAFGESSDESGDEDYECILASAPPKPFGAPPRPGAL